MKASTQALASYRCEGQPEALSMDNASYVDVFS
jgi:hypothetical protein